MAQAAIDLPDDVKPSSENADDLLSQLAGDEIDRLLSEAAVEPEKPAPAAAAKDSAAPNPSTVAASEASKAVENPDVGNQINDLLSGLDNPAPPAKEIPSPADQAAAGNATFAEADLKGELPHGEEREALLEAAGFDHPTGESTPDISKTLVRSLDGPSADIPQDDERSALLAAAGFDSPIGTTEDGSAVAAEHHGESTEGNASAALHQTESARLPLIFRPLEWLNAPLANAPALRRLLGLIGIATILTSVSFIGYVMIFRKH